MNARGGSIPKRGPVVAIDGPAGSGKTTLARELARRLGLPYVNTGLMYRAVAARSLGEGVSPGNATALAELAGSLMFSLDVPAGGGVVPELAIDGQSAGPELTSTEVEAIVSDVARHPEVRAVLREAQRALGADGCVMEGRDIGTVVFPDADVKLFLSAPAEVRVHRRQRERGGDTGAGEAVVRRDALDAKTNPPEPAPDAYVLDTTGLGTEQVLEAALAVVRTVLGEEIDQ